MSPFGPGDPGPTAPVPPLAPRDPIAPPSSSHFRRRSLRLAAREE